MEDSNVNNIQLYKNTKRVYLPATTGRFMFINAYKLSLILTYNKTEYFIESVFFKLKKRVSHDTRFFWGKIFKFLIVICYTYHNCLIKIRLKLIISFNI